MGRERLIGEEGNEEREAYIESSRREGIL